jgi:hypothetical protein
MKEFSSILGVPKNAGARRVLRSGFLSVPGTDRRPVAPENSGRTDSCDEAGHSIMPRDAWYPCRFRKLDPSVSMM